MMKPFVAFLTLFCFASALDSQKHEDSRCLCKCPDVSTVDNVGDDKGCNAPMVAAGDGSGSGYQEPRFIYLNASVAPDECDCQHVVLIRLNLTDAQAKSFCPRCKCTFQVRSLTMMKVVVILVIWIISILVIYMFFLSCLDPILNSKRGGVRGAVSYLEQRNEFDNDEVGDDRIGSQGQSRGAPMSTQMRAVGGHSENVINRLGNQQNRWKQQVQEQRRNIYDRHTILN